MQGQIELLFAFIVYIGIFAWVGTQLGARRVQWMLVVTAVSYFLIIPQQLLIRVANIGGKFLAFIKAGGLGSNPDEAFGALGNAPQIITQEGSPIFLFILWIVIVLFAWQIIAKKVEPGATDITAALWGMGGGFLVAWFVLPMMLRVIAPEATIIDGEEGTSIRRMLSVIGGAFRDTYGGLREYYERVAGDLGLLALLSWQSLERTILLCAILYIFYQIFRSRGGESKPIPYSEIIRYAAIIFVVYLAVQVYIGSGGIKPW